MSKDTYIQYIGTFYRRVQILVILTDKCFQSYVWPAIQFYGAIGVIVLLYVLLVLEQVLPISAKLGLATFAVGVIVLICLMLGMGSKTIIVSCKILQRVKLWNANAGNKLSRKFFRSCPTIALRVGEFHKMDSERAPALIRFILQRTFFLVLRTKLSYNYNRTNELEFLV